MMTKLLESMQKHIREGFRIVKELKYIKISCEIRRPNELKKHLKHSGKHLF